jgi:hypothetical protein
MLFRKKKEVKPDIYTEQTCQSCGEKSRRRFEENDYVYRTGARCKKCESANTLISAIYGEYPEEAKN